MDRPHSSKAASCQTLTEWVNGRTGTVGASGHLTAQGADLLRGTLESLTRQGHRTVLLDLADVEVPDGAGTPLMRDLQAGVAACGGRLQVVRPPGRARACP